MFEYIELFYNPKRKHTNNGMLSPIDEANSILFGNLPNSPIFSTIWRILCPILRDMQTGRWGVDTTIRL